jgi:hypothetical protein
MAQHHIPEDLNIWQHCCENLKSHTLYLVSSVFGCNLFLLHAHILQPHWSSGAKVGGQACRIDLNVLQAMNARLRQQEQQCHHLEVVLRQQQQQSEIILKRKLTQTDLCGRQCRGNVVFVVGILSILAKLVQSSCVCVHASIPPFIS